MTAVRRTISSRSLPPPTSGITEVNFRRLLKSCEQVAAGDTLGREDLSNWQSSPVFHQYIDSLQELLSDLQGDVSRRCPRELLRIYGQKVDLLADRLQPVQRPAFFLSGNSVRSQTSTAPVIEAVPAIGDTAAVRQHPTSLPERPTANNSLIQLEGAARGRIERQRNMQDTLTEELVGLAAGLKRNAAAMQTAVADRGRLLEDADLALERNLEGAKQSAKQSKVIYRKGSRSFWFILLVLFFASGVFVGMYMFIKVTSMAGYRHATSQ